MIWHQNMKHFAKAALILLTAVSCSGGPAPELSILDTHPRLILSRQDIREMRRNAASGDEPFISCYRALLAVGDSVVAGKWSPAPQYGGDGMDFYLGGQRDGGMARDLAILWQISRDRLYADAALHIIETWTSSTEYPGIRLLESEKSPGIGMLVSRGIFPFLYAYDLLMADGLVSEAQQNRFCNWIRALVPVIKEGSRRWKFNNYYDRQWFQNHPAAETMGLLAIAVALGDKELARYAFDCRENERDVLDLVQGCILMEGDEPYYREPGNWPVHDGEIYDRYRHFSLEGHYGDYVTKANRGLQYCNLTCTLLTICAEICRNNGFDLYSWEGEHGERIPLVWKHYARYYSSHDCTDSIYEGEEWFINKNNQATSGLWEVAAGRFPDEPAFREVLDNNDRTGNGTLHLLGPVVLTHGRK